MATGNLTLPEKVSGFATCSAAAHRNPDPALHKRAIRVSGFGFWVSDFGFRVSGIGAEMARGRKFLDHRTDSRDRNRPESWLINLPGHLWRDKWTTLSGPISTPWKTEMGDCLRTPSVVVSAKSASQLNANARQGGGGDQERFQKSPEK